MKQDYKSLMLLKTSVPFLSVPPSVSFLSFSKRDKNQTNVYTRALFITENFIINYQTALKSSSTNSI